MRLSRGPFLQKRMGLLLPSRVKYLTTFLHKHHTRICHIHNTNIYKFSLYLWHVMHPEVSYLDVMCLSKIKISSKAPNTFESVLGEQEVTQSIQYNRHISLCVKLLDRTKKRLNVWSILKHILCIWSIYTEYTKHPKYLVWSMYTLYVWYACIFYPWIEVRQGTNEVDFFHFW